MVVTAPISPDLLSAALISKLRADVGLTGVLPEGASGIREESWKGTAFQYPNVRLVRPSLTPWGNGNCTDHQSVSRIIVLAFSTKDSSITVQTIQGLIFAALEGERLETAALSSLPLRSDARGPARPGTPLDFGRFWRGQVTFRTVIFPK